MNKLENRIETLANAAIIIAVLLSLGLGAYMFFPRGSQPSDLKAGDKLPAAGIDWSKTDRTLVLVLQKGCHFCAESAPFYKRLTAAAAASVSIVAALPGEPDESRAYLDELGVKVNEIIKINPGSLAIRGTPTLILVDSQGTITGVWAGKLGAEDEESVLRKVSLKKEKDGQNNIRSNKTMFKLRKITIRFIALAIAFSCLGFTALTVFSGPAYAMKWCKFCTYDPVSGQYEVCNFMAANCFPHPPCPTMPYCPFDPS